LSAAVAPLLIDEVFSKNLIIMIVFKRMVMLE